MANPATKSASIARLAARYQRVALMLQGGGALGSYQVGVYKALAEADCVPNWICGVSIGAINGAIIAGNAPENRVARLEEFWSLVASRPIWPFEQTGLAADPLRELGSMASAWMTLAMGQPGFFRPRMINPWLLPTDAAGSTSFYDSSELRQTLMRLVNFDRLNSGETRLSVGAVNVRTGNNIFFDTEHELLEPEHIMASGALPPALPMVKIGDDFFWDGGIVSNTPLQYLLDDDGDVSSLVFQVDLFSARGALPRQMAQVMARQKDIVYSSRTRQATTAFKRVLSLRRQLAEALKRVPAKLLQPGERELMQDYADAGVVNLIQLIYQGKKNAGDSKDYEFSSDSMREHAAAGYADTTATLAHPDWLDLPSNEDGISEHDVHRPKP
jgi:NTE family protein